MAVRALTIALCFVDGTGAPAPTDNEINAMWHSFKTKYNKEYNDVERFKVFKDNVMQAHSMNEEQGAECVDYFEGPECVFGVTEFSAMLPAEFAKTKLGYKRSGNALNASVLSSFPLVADPAVDWREKGAVTAVKDQGQCGSCWAFSTTETIESQLFMKTGKLDDLSTQQIISCDKVDAGCDGGDPPTAYAYVEKAGGLDTAADYPDKSHKSGNTGKCKWDKKEDVKVTGFAYAVKPCNKGACKHQDEVGLAAALATKGPISICVNAGAAGWQSYQKGIFSAKCSGAAADLDHCVQLVGYNKAGQKPYWIVRNSWADSWGVAGYMYLEMGKNLCGVADEATIPAVAASVQMPAITV